MIEIGYTLSSEEFGHTDLIGLAARAEEAGFTFALISDHFHPWIDRQGHSPFVWGVIGGVAQATKELRLGTGVTCPTMRTHPAIVAQAAATAGCMMPGRFFLGVGSGEALNEHIVGKYWPPADVRMEMLEEAVSVIRLLWEGGVKSHRGPHFTVANARIYGGSGKPRYGQITVCWAKDREEARKTATEWWPNTIQGELSQELPLPRHFDQAAGMVEERELDEAMPIGPDPEEYLEAVLAYGAAGYDHVYVHQVGPDQEGFIRFCEREVMPKIG